MLGLFFWSLYLYNLTHASSPVYIHGNALNLIITSFPMYIPSPTICCHFWLAPDHSCWLSMITPSSYSLSHSNFRSVESRLHKASSRSLDSIALLLAFRAPMHTYSAFPEFAREEYTLKMVSDNQKFSFHIHNISQPPPLSCLINSTIKFPNYLINFLITLSSKLMLF